MGCGGKRKSPELVQITVVQRDSNQKRVASNIEDFHCPECGLTLRNRSRNYYHRCPGPRPISYQIERTEKCGTCEHNVDDVCVLYKEMHPDRDAVISVGIKMPWAHCPIEEWHRVAKWCERCGRFNFSADGDVDRCDYCGHNPVAKAASIQSAKRQPRPSIAPPRSSYRKE